MCLPGLDMVLGLTPRTVDVLVYRPARQGGPPHGSLRQSRRPASLLQRVICSWGIEEMIEPCGTSCLIRDL